MSRRGPCFPSRRSLRLWIWLAAVLGVPGVPFCLPGGNRGREAGAARTVAALVVLRVAFVRAAVNDRLVTRRAVPAEHGIPRPGLLRRRAHRVIECLRAPVVGGVSLDLQDLADRRPAHPLLAGIPDVVILDPLGRVLHLAR